jgi:hypothetical protein
VYCWVLHTIFLFEQNFLLFEQNFLLFELNFLLFELNFLLFVPNLSHHVFGELLKKAESCGWTKTEFCAPTKPAVCPATLLK